MTKPLLRIAGLRTAFRMAGGGEFAAVDGVDLEVPRGRTLGVVGESGCGKSVLSLSVMRLVPRPGRIAAGTIELDGRDLLSLPSDAMRQVRGGQVAMIFQEPMTSLNPVHSVGTQIMEAMRAHDPGARDLRDRAVEALRRVRIPAPERRFEEYPHQLSGGMRQRVMIAMALACAPKLLIADEPTTALDVTVQAQILDLLRELQAETGMSIILITHDLGVVAEMADEVAVMYAGRVVERAPARALFEDPQHPYTLGLLGSVPRLDEDRARLLAIEGVVPPPFALPQGCRFNPRCPFALAACRAEVPPLREIAPGHRAACLRAPGRGEPRGMSDAAPLLEVEGLAKHFPVRRGLIRAKQVGTVRAVDGVSFALRRGETLALVGESGCGKSTTARLVLRLIEPSAGAVRFEGEDLTARSRGEMRRLRRRMQIIFQDPYASLNPRLAVGDTLEEPMIVHGLGDAAARAARVRELLGLVGLASYHATRYPHEFSGGQRQRIGIARALAVQPDLIVCDEPVSALDVSIQAQVVNLLKELQQRFGLAYLFIAHDLAVVRHMADRVAVMYLGRIVEIAEKRALFADPRHPYTRALLSAIPRPDPRLRGSVTPLGGDVPSPMNPPSGCRFHTRCPLAKPVCAEREPPMIEVAPGHVSACHFARDLPASGLDYTGGLAPAAAKRLALFASASARGGIED